MSGEHLGDQLALSKYARHTIYDDLTMVKSFTSSCPTRSQYRLTTPAHHSYVTLKYMTRDIEPQSNTTHGTFILMGEDLSRCLSYTLIPSSPYSLSTLLTSVLMISGKSSSTTTAPTSPPVLATPLPINLLISTSFKLRRPTPNDL
jgi:hypothetical protein